MVKEEEMSVNGAVCVHEDDEECAGVKVDDMAMQRPFFVRDTNLSLVPWKTSCVRCVLSTSPVGGSGSHRL